MQQLLQNSQFGGHSLGRPPQLPMDRAARSPFDVALGKALLCLEHSIKLSGLFFLKKASLVVLLGPSLGVVSCIAGSTRLRIAYQL